MINTEVPVGALYIQSFPILRKLKSNYRNLKVVFHFNLLTYMFTLIMRLFQCQQNDKVIRLLKNCIRNSEILNE